jgi:hypothetical protein
MFEFEGPQMSRNSTGYEDDFFAWTAEQAQLLRTGRFSQLDVENVAEEIESMGRRDKREIESRLEVLLMHLLKWQVQVSNRSSGWAGTIREQRRRIEKLLRESPSLTPTLRQMVPEAYAEARHMATLETGLAETAFPASCSYTFAQILSAEFLPEDQPRRAAGAGRRGRS